MSLSTSKATFCRRSAEHVAENFKIKVAMTALEDQAMLCVLNRCLQRPMMGIVYEIYHRHADRLLEGYS